MNLYFLINNKHNVDGSAPEPILRARRGEKAHHDDKKNIRVVSPKIEK